MEGKALFMHERLDAYRFAVQFYREVKAIRGGLPRGLGPLGDQVSRAAQSIVLNLAEGAAARSVDVKQRHWQIALGSAGECAAALDLLEIGRAAADAVLQRGREALRQAVVRMLGLVR
jgi:four helix bundle protein